MLDNRLYSGSKPGEVLADCETPGLNRLAKSYAFSVSKLRSFSFYIHLKVIIFEDPARTNELKLLKDRSVC